MKILYLTDQIYLHGGAEKILIQKLNHWVEKFGYEVTLVTTQQKGKNPFFRLNPAVKMIDLGIDYTEGVSYFKYANFSKFRTHYKKLKAVINDINPDATFVISQSLLRFITPFAAGKHKIYYEYHTSYYGFQLGYEKLPALKKLKKQISYKVIEAIESKYTNVVFLNQAEYDHYKRKNAVIIPNFFDEIIHPVHCEKKKQVITLGRLSYQKGYDLLIDAWGLIAKEAPDWTLEIFGNGENRSKLEQQIGTKNLGHTIHLNEATDEVNLKLSESAFYVMSSRFETFPMVLLEAMSNKLPVVSFDCPTGPSSMLTINEDGLLAAPGDIRELADKMLEMINNEPLRQIMGDKAARNVTRFNPEMVMKKWDVLIKRK